MSRQGPTDRDTRPLLATKGNSLDSRAEACPAAAVTHVLCGVVGILLGFGAAYLTLHPGTAVLCTDSAHVSPSPPVLLLPPSAPPMVPVHNDGSIGWLATVDKLIALLTAAAAGCVVIIAIVLRFRAHLLDPTTAHGLISAMRTALATAFLIPTLRWVALLPVAGDVSGKSLLTEFMQLVVPIFVGVCAVQFAIINSFLAYRQEGLNTEMRQTVSSELC
jgi:hypothetical protein